MKLLAKCYFLRRPVIYLQARSTFFLLLFWPVIIWFFFRGCLWVAEIVMYLTGKPLKKSVILYIQKVITLDMLIHIFVSWIALLLILFVLAISVSWLLQRLIPHND